MCRVLCLVPSHSVISMGDAFSVSLGVRRHPVNQSLETRSWTHCASVPSKKKDTTKQKDMQRGKL